MAPAYPPHSNVLEKWQSWGESLTKALTGLFDYVSNGMAAQAEYIALNSGLSGMVDGPADALKHITLAAMLAMEGGGGAAYEVMSEREALTDFFYVGTNSTMDRVNNTLGIEIGVYLRNRGIQSRRAAIELSEKYVREAVKEGQPCSLWKQGPNGLRHHEGIIDVVRGELSLPYPVLVKAPRCVPD